MGNERIKIEKVEKLVVNLHDKAKYVIHIRNLKQTLTHGLVLKKVHRVIKFNENAWLNPSIDMNTDLKKAKNDFERDFFKLMNNEVFIKTMENLRKQRDIKLVTTERRRNYFVSKPNYQTTKFFKENLLVIDMKKTEILMNKPVYIGFSIIALSKVLMYEFWYDYVKPKHGEKAILRYMDTDSFTVYLETNDVYKDVAEDEKIFWIKSKKL